MAKNCRGFIEINTANMGEEKEMLNPNVDGNSVSQCSRCNELEGRCKKAEVRYAELELEFQKKKDHYEELEAKVMALEGEKFEFEDKLKVFSDELERLKEVSSGKEGEIKAIADLTEENEADQLVIEKKVLQCEKIRAESEVELWKDKYQKLESWALQLGMGRGICEGNGKKQENKPVNNEGNLHLDTSFGFWQNPKKVVAMGNKNIGDMQSADKPADVIKQLTFETEESPSRKMAPSTLIGAKFAPVSVIDIFDSDDEPSITKKPVPDSQGSKSISVATCFAAQGKHSNNSWVQNNQEGLDLGEDLLFVATPKRKRTCNVVTSDSENDDEDIPIRNLKRNHIQEVISNQVRPDLSSLLPATISKNDEVTDTDDDDIPICNHKRNHVQEVISNQVRPDLSSSLPAAISETDKVTDTVITRRRLLPLRECVSKSQDDKILSCRPRKAKHKQSIATNDDIPICNHKRNHIQEVALSSLHPATILEFTDTDDDDIPLCNHKRNHIQEVTLSSLHPATILENDEVTDTDDDVDIPICNHKRNHIQEVISNQVRPDFSSSLPATISENDKVADTVMTSCRLLPLRECVKESKVDKLSSCRPRKAKHKQSIATNDDVDESEEDSSFSGEENMSDFIVDDSDISNCEDTSSSSQDVSNCDVDSDSINSEDVQDSKMDSDSQDASDGNMDFSKILSKIKRSKNNMKWEFEANMLAAFGKDPELCMKAVCALYRQQTAEEQMSKGALLSNRRGFSKLDAHRGSILAEFITDGDPCGGLKKSVKELQEFDPEAVELCRSLATHYSKQLYEIYKNKEDPLFPG